MEPSAPECHLTRFICQFFNIEEHQGLRWQGPNPNLVHDLGLNLPWGCR